MAEVTEVRIDYNPYRIETEILVNGETPKANSKLYFENRRLQEWIEELPELLAEECAARNFRIVFHGTLPDYEDLVAVVNDAKAKGISIDTEHIPAKEVADKESAITEIFDEIQAGPFDELKQPDVVKAFNLAKSTEFEVSVVATMSAGKSTLINALLRKKLMPSKQEACTATVTEIKDTDSDHFSARAYDTSGDLIQTCHDLTLEEMDKMNSNPQISTIRVEGDIPFVPANEEALVLVDTPGPNNARDPEHKTATYRMLSESSKTLVLYIMNATQLNITDDDNLLKYVAESMKVGGKQSRDRFMFVVNKLDDFRSGEDSVKESLAKVKEYLESCGIENANIYPASALTALYIRTVLNDSQKGNYNQDDIDEAELKVRKFNRNDDMHFENYAPLTPSMKDEINQMISTAREKGDSNTEALIHSGIVPIEMAIQVYLQKYSRTAKIKNIVDTFSKRLESAGSFEKTKQEIINNQNEKDDILANIAIIRKKLESGEEAKKFKERTDNINYEKDINKESKQIVKELQTELTKTLSTDAKLTRDQAEREFERFTGISNDILAKLKVKMENLVTNDIVNNANALLDEYKKKIADLSQDINVGKVDIDPFDLMEGEIDRISDMNQVLSEVEEEEDKYEKVGSHTEYDEFLGVRRFLNRTFGTHFHVNSHEVDDYDWVTHKYINGEKLAQMFLAPVEEELFEKQTKVVDFAKKQARNVKESFNDKFQELDNLLNQKLKELENYAKDEEDTERKLSESKEKLAWLETIQDKISAILDI